MIIISIVPVPAIVISAKPTTSENTIYVTWSEADCASMYQLNIRSGSMEQTNTTTSTKFPFPVPAPGRYIFNLSSIDYFGRSVGDPVSTEICFTCEAFLLLILIIEDIFIVHNFNVRTVVNCTANFLTIIIQVSNNIHNLLSLIYFERKYRIENATYYFK